ncbi:MAG: ABC transporter ATP-binding protein [Oscillospiraceae bacterium]|nr:ABC transporter ATP-binding protein [Oscillospiraceae bacterium]
MSILTTLSLTKKYGRKTAIRDINVQVDEGAFFGLIGPNGSGKSTFFNILMDFVRPTKGNATIFDLDCQDSGKELKTQVGYVPAVPAFYDFMKVDKLLEYTKNFYGYVDLEYLDSLCERFQINRNKKISAMGFSDKKKLALATALLHKPRILLLDEPLAGLVPIIRRRFLDTIQELHESGVTVVYGSQELNEAGHLCDIVALMNEGIIIETKEVADKGHARGKVVELQVEGDISELVMSLGAERFMKRSDTVSFNYYSDMDRLIKSLAKYVVHDIRVTDVPLENDLMTYKDEEPTVWIF